MNIKPPLTWREPLWSHLTTFAQSRRVWFVSLALMSFSALSFTLLYGVRSPYADAPDYRLIVLGAAVGTLSFAGNVAMIIRYTDIGKVSPEQEDVSEYMRHQSKLPRRWRKVWLRAFGSKAALENAFYDSMKERYIYFPREHDVGDTRDWLYRKIDSYKRISNECIAEMRSLGISYRSYPAAFFLLFLEVEPALIRKWDSEGGDMERALKAVVDGVPVNRIGVVAKHDIDQSMMDSLFADSEDLALSPR